MELTLSSPCSHSDPPLSRQDAALAHLGSLPSHDLVIWTDGSVPFPSAKAALAFLPTAYFVALRPLFPFRKTQFVQVFLLKPAPFCNLFTGLGNTKKFAISLLLLSDFRFVLLRLFFYLKLSGRNCLLSPSLPLGYNGSPDTHFSRGTTWLISWLDGERYSCPLQSLVVSLLLPLVSTLVFSRTNALFKFLDTQVPSLSTEELVLPLHARVYSISSLLQWTQASAKLLSLYSWQNQGSFMHRLRLSKPGRLSTHSALSSYRLCAPHFLVALTLRPVVQALGSCPASGAP